MQKKISNDPTWKSHFGLFCLLLGLTACETWDLAPDNFPQVITGAGTETGTNPTQVLVEGEILGMLDNTSVEEHGHIWSRTDKQLTLEGGQVEFTRLNRANNSTFQSQITDLTPGRPIFYRAYATFEQKNVYGEALTYTPPGINLQIQTDAILSRSQDQGAFQMRIQSSVSGLPAQTKVKSYGIVWATQENPNVEQDNITLDGTNILNNAAQFTFQSKLTNLKYESYYARSYLAIADTVYYGSNFCLSPGDFWIDEAIPETPDLGCYTISLRIDDKIYFIGFSQWDCPSWCYDPQTKQFSKKASFPGIPRSFAKSTELNGKGYIGFGITDDPEVYDPEIYLNDLWEYDPGADVWTEKAPFSSGRYGPIFFAIGNYVYAGAGQAQSDPYTSFWAYDFWRLDPGKNEWARLGDSPGFPPYGSLSFALNGKGYTLSSATGFWEYFPQTDTWKEKALAIDDLTYGTPTFRGILDGQVYVSQESRWKYNPATDKWTFVGPDGFFQNSFFGIGQQGYALIENRISVYYPLLECE